MNNNLKKIQESIKNDIEKLSQYTSTIGEGTTRLPFTKESRQAVDYIKKVMNEIGMNVHEDYAGSVIGKLECSAKNAKSIIIGSHYDSVKNGGNFDGIAGAVARKSGQIINI